MSITLQEYRVEWLAEGRLEGRREGRQEGRQEGRVEERRQLLTKRFGPLSAADHAKLAAAAPDQLELWADRFLDVDSLAALWR